MKHSARWLVAAVALLAAFVSASAVQAAGTGADLQISGSASSGSPNPGGALAYTFQVKNSGPDAANGIVFSDPIPAGMTYTGSAIAGYPGACSFAGGVVTCNVFTLAKGSQLNVEVDVAAPLTSGSYPNTATVSSATTDPQPGNNSSTVTVQVKAVVCPAPAGQSWQSGLVMGKFTNSSGLFENFTWSSNGVNYFVRTNFYDGSAPLTSVINLNCKTSPNLFIQVGNFVNVIGTPDGFLADGTPVIDASIVQVLTFADKA